MSKIILFVLFVSFSVSHYFHRYRKKNHENMLSIQKK